MKKIILPACLVLILGFSSCYESSDKAAVKINLGNIPIAKQIENKTFIDRILSFFTREAYAQSAPEDITGINIAVLDNGRAIYTGKFSASNTEIVFYTPPGKNLTIIVGAEGNDYENPGSSKIILYYGKAVADIELNKENTVTVTMYNMDELFTFGYSYDTDIISWSSVDGSERYELWQMPMGGEEYIKIADTTANFYDLGGYTQDNFRVRCFFQIFSIYSEFSPSFMP